MKILNSHIPSGMSRNRTYLLGCYRPGYHLETIPILVLIEGVDSNHSHPIHTVFNCNLCMVTFHFVYFHLSYEQDSNLYGQPCGNVPSPHVLDSVSRFAIIRYCDPSGTRTQNPHIKSVVRYQLCQEVI